MGYRLVQAVLVVTVGRLGDMFGRVRIYNSGFVVFTVASAQPDYRAFADRIGQATAAGVAPGSPEGQALLDSIVPAAGRARLLTQLETFTDARVERYWQLLAILNGQSAPPSVVPAFDWLIAALRADLS